MLSKIIKGFMAFLPLLLFVWICSFIYSIVAKLLLKLFGFTDNNIVSTIVIIASTLSILYYAGYLYDKKKDIFILKISEYFLKKIPFLHNSYKTIKDIISIMNPSNQNYLGSVFVTFADDMSMIGFITKEEGEHYWVFVPTTPNPTNGFLIKIEKKKVVDSKISISDSFSKIISMGVK